MRHKNKPIMMLAMFFGLTLLATVSSSFSSAGHIGVSVGDWVKYKIVRGGDTNTAWMGDYEFDDWIRIEVLNVSGTLVSLHEAHWQRGGGFRNITTQVDLAKDGGEFQLTFAGFGVGDIIPCEDWQKAFNVTFMIKEEATRLYCGENRTVLKTEIFYSEPYAGYILDTREEFWWDKGTGILVDKIFETVIHGYEQTTKSFAGFSIEQTSLWGKQTQDTPWSWFPAGVMSVGAIIGIVGVVISERDNIKKRLKR
jgi:hypothetical protein